MSAEAVSLNDLVREVLVLYESMGVPIEPHLAENLPAVPADRALLRQVLHNLIQNAIDALAGADEPRIVVTSELAGESVQLSVSDNGSGIADNVIERIFEPYVTTKPKGTGLGLAIVKKIVDEHHGRIDGLVNNAFAMGPMARADDRGSAFARPAHDAPWPHAGLVPGHSDDRSVDCREPVAHAHRPKFEK